MLHPKISPGACRRIILTSGVFMLVVRQMAIEEHCRNTLTPVLKKNLNIKSSILPAIWSAS